ncbi:NACHT, LRR and PYD domains-containing protein 1 homolog [Sardina pilchardus]|uniref:NACHT, LRR and PYD domains-containing protein 1 homolog n=1 Tax=Sardina pilchardus TaxID=27697 RepID=UPI002E0E95B7
MMMNMDLASPDDVSCNSIRKHRIPISADESVVKRRRHSDQSTLVLEYKNSVRLKYETVREHDSLSGEEVLLVDRYSQLLIVQKHRDQHEREEEMRSKGPVFQQVLQARASERYRQTRVDQLFSSDYPGDAPSTVILQGHSGHGKSFTVQKIMYDWATDSLFQDYVLVLHVCCKELNSEDEKSAIDLLSLTEEFAPMVSQILLQSPEKVLLLIDGFDELGLPLDGAKAPVPTDLFSEAPVKDIVSALLSRSVLSDCSLLVTTRSTASNRLSKVLKQPQRFAEILGFSESGVRDYFHRFFRDEQMAEKVHASVRSNETLYNACFIPLICGIVCSVFKDQFKAGADVAKGLETTTSIFVHFVSTLLEHHCQGSEEPEPTLRALGQLAERGTQDKQVLFDERSVHAAVPDPSTMPFLCKFLRPAKARLQSLYGFMHLSFQEFFCALFCVLQFPEEPQKLHEMLPVHADDEGDVVKSHLQPVIQFLFGLSNGNVRRSLTGSVGSAAALIRPRLENWMRRAFRYRKEFKPDRHVLFVLHCLYELHEEPFVREIVEMWQKVHVGFVPMSRTDCWVLLFCLQCCPTIRSLSLLSCNLTSENMRMLLPALHRCEELGLDLEDLSDNDIGDLIMAIGEGKTLNKLGVFNSSLSDESVQQLCGALCRQKHVGSVQLSVKTITANTAAALLHSLHRSHIQRLIVDVTKESDSDEKSLCLCLSAENYTKRLQLHRSEDTEACGSVQSAQMDTERTLELSYEYTVVTLSHHRRYKHLGVKDLHTYEPPNQPAVSELSVFLSHSPETHTSQWTQFLLHFHALRGLNEGDTCFEEHLDGLMGSLHSLTGLAEVELVVNSVTVSLTAKIISLIHACLTLQEIKVKAGWRFGPGFIADGLLLEEGVQLLREAHLRPDCKLTLQGKRCTKPFEKCGSSEDRRLSCNRQVEVVVWGELMEEHSSEWDSLSEGDWGEEEEQEDETKEIDPKDLMQLDFSISDSTHFRYKSHTQLGHSGGGLGESSLVKLVLPDYCPVIGALCPRGRT